MLAWQQLPLLERIRRLRYMLPPLLAMLVVGYQLGVARTLESNYGHLIHYGGEIAFYSMAGPFVTWITLAWVERRLAEKESLERQVRAREQQLANLTTASADAIVSLDGLGHIVSWNRGAERLFDYVAAEVMGRPLNELLPEADRLAEHLRHDGVIQNFETTALRQDGQAITVDLTQTLLPENETEAPASLLIMRDVTLRHERAAILEEERARIARDLHDGVAQTLYFLALKADIAAEQLGQHPEQVETHLQEIGQQARRVIREVRRTIFALHPLDWSRVGFLPALRRFIKDFAEQVNWQISIEISDEIPTILATLEPTIFRLVQESLNNIAKHAEAKRVWVDLGQDEPDAYLTLTVRDDGRGFDSTFRSGRGLGLGQMRQRVEAIGGTFKLESRLNGGTTVTAQIPFVGRSRVYEKNSSFIS